MIRIGTVHYRDDRWIEPQLRYLERYTEEPYRVYASLDGVDPRHATLFHRGLDHTRVLPGDDHTLRISQKVNLLIEEMLNEAARDDLLVIAHGDTLPIREWSGPVRRMIAESPLVAIRRDEVDEPMPHWSFVATTAGFWTEIGADWSRGPNRSWKGTVMMSDMGASLGMLLEARGVEWRPLLRSNETDLHPLLFGVYGDLVYHHGAGFRPSMTRPDSRRYSHLPVPLRNLEGVRTRIVNTYRSQRLFRQIGRDERFHRVLTGDRA